MQGTSDQTESHGEEALRARYDMLRAKVVRKQRIEEGQAEALPFLAQAYGDTLNGSPMLKRATDWAQKFCIVAAGVIPIFLFFWVVI